MLRNNIPPGPFKFVWNEETKGSKGMDSQVFLHGIGWSEQVKMKGMVRRHLILAHIRRKLLEPKNLILVVRHKPLVTRTNNHEETHYRAFGRPWAWANCWKNGCYLKSQKHIGCCTKFIELIQCICSWTCPQFSIESSHNVFPIIKEATHTFRDMINKEIKTALTDNQGLSASSV